MEDWIFKVVGVAFILVGAAMAGAAIRTTWHANQLRQRLRDWQPGTAEVTAVERSNVQIGTGDSRSFRTQEIATYSYSDSYGAQHTGRGDLDGVAVSLGPTRSIPIRINPANTSESIPAGSAPPAGVMAGISMVLLVFGVGAIIVGGFLISHDFGADLGTDEPFLINRIGN